MIYHATPDNAIADWDSTVTTRYSRQEDVAIGYNPHKPGRASHHPLVCAIADTRLALHMRWRKGNTVSATEWQEAMEEVWAHPVARARIKLSRGDIGFGQEKVMAWYEEQGVQRPAYLFKLKLTSGVKKAISKINWPQWQDGSAPGLEQIAETSVKLHGWSMSRRIIVSRTLKPLNPRRAGRVLGFGLWSTFRFTSRALALRKPMRHRLLCYIVSARMPKMCSMS